MLIWIKGEIEVTTTDVLENQKWELNDTTSLLKDKQGTYTSSKMWHIEYLVKLGDTDAKIFIGSSDPKISGTLDFDSENGVDGEKAMDKMGSVKCEFSKDDIEFWFSELETQLKVIETIWSHGLDWELDLYR